MVTSIQEGWKYLTIRRHDHIANPYNVQTCTGSYKTYLKEGHVTGDKGSHWYNDINTKSSVQSAGAALGTPKHTGPTWLPVTLDIRHTKNGVPVVVQPKQILDICSSIPGLDQWVKDLALLWLWHTPAAVAPIRPLVWEPPYATSVALK